MPKNSLLDMVRRLMAVDEALADEEGLEVGPFAAHWGVDVRTIERRDLRVLTALGRTHRRVQVGEGEFVLRYAAGVERLFR